MSYKGSQEQILTTQSPIKSGKKVRTSENSALNFQVDKISSIDLMKNTSLEIVSCTEDVQVFKLEQGDLLAQVGKSSSGRVFRVETPNASCEIVGTRFSISVYQDTTFLQVISVLSVFEGRVKFTAANGKEVFVDSGQFVKAINDSCGSAISFDQKAKTVKTKSVYAFQIITHPASALVEIDGQYAGITPLKGSALQGEHQISITRNGYRSWSGKINLSKTTNKKFEIALESEIISPSDQAELTVVSALIESGHIDSALYQLREIYLKSSVSDNLRAAALKKTAMCYKLSGKTHEAIATLESIVKGPFSDNYKESALFQIASLRSSEFSDYVGAIKDLQKYIKDYPEGIWAEEAHFNLAELLYIQKNYRGSVSTYKRIISDYPNSSRISDALYSLAKIFSRDLDDCENALKLFGRVETDFPKCKFAEDAVFWKADCLLRQGRATQAIEEYGKYLSKYPEGKWVAEAGARIRKTDLSGVN